MRRAPEFHRALRSGWRATRGCLVVHLARNPPPPQTLISGPEPATGPGRVGPATRVGLVVPKSVGGAVVRNRVKRRLRALLAEHLVAGPRSRSAAGSPAREPSGPDEASRPTLLVVRALPAAGTASYTVLSDDLAAALAAACSRGAGVSSGGRR